MSRESQNAFMQETSITWQRNNDVENWRKREGLLEEKKREESLDFRAGRISHPDWVKTGFMFQFSISISISISVPISIGGQRQR